MKELKAPDKVHLLCLLPYLFPTYKALRILENTHLRAEKDKKIEGAVSKWLYTAMRGSALLNAVFGSTKTTQRKAAQRSSVFWNYTKE